MNKKFITLLTVQQKTVSIVQVNFTEEKQSVWQPNELIKFVISKNNEYKIECFVNSVLIDSKNFKKATEAQEYAVNFFKKISTIDNLRVYLSFDELKEHINKQGSDTSFDVSPEIQDMINEFKNLGFS